MGYNSRKLTMRKYIFVLVVLFVAKFVNAQEIVSNDGNDVVVVGGNDVVETDEPTCVHTNGLCMNFPKAGLTGMYNPALGWSISECTYSDGKSIKYESLLLISTASDTYYSFDEDSRVLIRFTDESVATLRRDIKSPIEKKYENMWMGNSLMHFYHTYCRLNLDTETRQKLLNPALGIVKIRIVYTNGLVRDYELKGKRISKFPEELRESYQQAVAGNKARIQNNDDSTF